MQCAKVLIERARSAELRGGSRIRRERRLLSDKRAISTSRYVQNQPQFPWSVERADGHDVTNVTLAVAGAISTVVTSRGIPWPVRGKQRAAVNQHETYTYATTLLIALGARSAKFAQRRSRLSILSQASLRASISASEQWKPHYMHNIVICAQCGTYQCSVVLLHKPDIRRYLLVPTRTTQHQHEEKHTS